MNYVFETRFAIVGETSEHYRQAKINSSTSAKEWTRYCLSDYFQERLDQEEFLIATLDTSHRVRRVVRITRGTLDASLVHPREVFRPAIKDAASSILLIHNHPGGSPEFSPQDIQVSERLEECGRLLGITVLDHIIVTSDKSIAWREQR